MIITVVFFFNIFVVVDDDDEGDAFVGACLPFLCAIQRRRRVVMMMDDDDDDYCHCSWQYYVGMFVVVGIFAIVEEEYNINSRWGRQDVCSCFFDVENDIAGEDNDDDYL